MAFFTRDYLDFFIELAPNNNKDWFDVNRKRYERSVKQPFSDFVAHMIRTMEKHDGRMKDLEPGACIFRINRDIRFSKDKSPYKLFCSAVLAPNGKKSVAVNGIYFEAGPEALRVYGGIYEIDKENLIALREGIAANREEFDSLKNDPVFVDTFGSILGEKNKILPAELKAAAAHEPLLYNKQLYFMAEFDADRLLQDDVDKLLEACYLAGRPLETFFNRFIQRA